MVNIMQQKKMVLRKNKMEKGLSLIEASMVLALSAIVVSGVMFYYQSASDSNKTQNTVSQVMSVMSAINGLYVGQASYSGLSDTVLYNSSAVPANYKGSTAGVINNPFGGRLHVAPNTGASGGYALLLDGVPQSSCVNIASMNLGTSLQGVGVKTSMQNTSSSVNLTATTATNPVTPGKIYSGTLTPANAATLCTDVTNSITFLMK
ncbi:TPA: pilus assembly protein [Escherichia coli]|nr:pilus assembly protein [Escherichia coli]HAO0724744.1 pilus assembly protein [Escherichia coli]HAO1235042.1 pilus assembly protein [Escherichia coli]HAX7638756.1 pilus assembly protein [Escherichia coli]HBA4943652.1 pilus assembly protein [Escherichia coli]